MNILAIDTARDEGSLAYACDDEIKAEVTLARENQAEVLVEVTLSLLREEKTDIASLDVIAVVTGPGSFSGIRIGIAAAKGLAFAQKASLIGVSSFELAAWSSEKDIITLTQDARRGQLYTQSFENGKAKHEATLIKAEEKPEGAVQVDEDITLDASLLARFVLAHPSREASDVITPVYVRPPDAKLPKSA